MSVKSSLNLTPTLSLVRRGSINLVSPLTKGGLKGGRFRVYLQNRDAPGESLFNSVRCCKKPELLYSKTTLR
jgi:hypothetical protein